MALNLIRKNNQTAVTAYQDCVILHFSKGHDQTGATIGGVFQGVYNAFGYELDNVNFKFNLKSGMGMIYGRQFELPGNEVMPFDFSTLVGIFYILIYAEIDTQDPTDQKVSIKAVSQELAYPVVTSTNLITTEQGIARMPLYTLMYNSAQASRLYAVAAKFMVYVPDTVEYAKTARSLPGESTINGRTVSNIVNPNKDTVKEADSADAARGHIITEEASLNTPYTKRRLQMDGKILAGMARITKIFNWTGQNVYSEVYYLPVATFQAEPDLLILAIYPDHLSSGSGQRWISVLVPIEASGYEDIPIPDTFYSVSLVGLPGASGYGIKIKASSVGSHTVTVVIRTLA